MAPAWYLATRVVPSRCKRRLRSAAIASASAIVSDRKSTRLNSSHTEIYTLSLHDALPICQVNGTSVVFGNEGGAVTLQKEIALCGHCVSIGYRFRSEEHTSELQSHRDLHSFPTRRSSDLPGKWHQRGIWQRGWCRHAAKGDCALRPLRQHRLSF